MVRLNPLVGYAVAAALAVGAATGYKIRDWQCDAAYAAALEKSEKQRAKKQKVVDDVSVVYEDERNQADVVATERINTIREIYKTLPADPVDCSVPDAVVRLLENSVSDANAAATGKPSVTVPVAVEPAGPAG